MCVCGVCVCVCVCLCVFAMCGFCVLSAEKSGLSGEARGNPENWGNNSFPSSYLNTPTSSGGEHEKTTALLVSHANAQLKIRAI